MSARCRSCHAEIRWALTEANATAMPINADPDPDGNVTLEPRGPIGVMVATVHGPLGVLMLDADEPRYMPHHATCPDADTWRPA